MKDKNSNVQDINGAKKEAGPDLQQRLVAIHTKDGKEYRVGQDIETTDVEGNGVTVKIIGMQFTSQEIQAVNFENLKKKPPVTNIKPKPQTYMYYDILAYHPSVPGAFPFMMIPEHHVAGVESSVPAEQPRIIQPGSGVVVPA